MTRHSTPEQRYDHERDERKHDAPNALDRIIADLPRRAALSKLIGYCEGIANSGVLGAEVTPRFRQLIDDAAEKHDMPVRKVEVVG